MTTTPTRVSVAPGALVIVDGESVAARARQHRLGVVSHCVGNGEWAVLVVNADGGTPEQVAGAWESVHLPEADVKPVNEPDTLDILSRRNAVLVHRMMTHVIEQQTQQLATLADASARASEAVAKIASMRRYAIRAYERSDICRDGLDRFLRAYDLPPYQREYRARVTVTTWVNTSDILREDITSEIQRAATLKFNDDSLWLEGRNDVKVSVDAIERIDG
ncbi:hypothetical protein ACQEVF_58020 [Nonomuraea polychroma]|uniref:hypothetical protein n=1 Tax=Nonomuraea polychroma TaxID=46176 RepID=UPI003D8C169D